MWIRTHRCLVCMKNPNLSMHHLLEHTLLSLQIGTATSTYCQGRSEDDIKRMRGWIVAISAYSFLGLFPVQVLFCQPRVEVTSCFVYKVMGLSFHDRINTQLIYRIAVAQVVTRRITKPQRTFFRFESHWGLLFIHFFFILGGGGRWRSDFIILFMSYLFFFLFLFIIIFLFLCL